MEHRLAVEQKVWAEVRRRVSKEKGLSEEEGAHDNQEEARRGSWEHIDRLAIEKILKAKEEATRWKATKKWEKAKGRGLIEGSRQWGHRVKESAGKGKANDPGMKAEDDDQEDWQECVDCHYAEQSAQEEINQHTKEAGKLSCISFP